MLIHETGAGDFAFGWQDLTQGVTACDWHIRAQDILNCLDDPFRLRL